jgi:hypothetical protein
MLNQTAMDSKNINYQLKGIELVSFTLNQPQERLNQERVYNFEINVEQRINPEEKLIHVFVSIDLIQDEDKQCHASIKTGCVFMVDNLSEFISATTNLVELPDQFVVTLNSISLSTTRGIMFSQFRGTYMHSAILPIVNPATFHTIKISKNSQ